jgi:hypothetical protein
LEEAESDDSEGGAPKKNKAATEATTEGATEDTSESESQSEEESQARDLDNNASSPSEGEVEITAKDDGETGGMADQGMDMDVDTDNNREASELTIWNIFCYFLTFKFSF